MSKKKQKLPLQGHIIKHWWMLHLGLKGTKLEAFAIVYSFSQDGQSEYKGGSTFIQKWTGCTKKTALGALNAINDQGLVHKRMETVSGNTYSRYRANMEIVHQFTPGVKITPGGATPGVKITPTQGKNYTQPGVKITPSIIKSNTKGNTRGTFVPPTREDVARVMAKKLDDLGSPSARRYAWEESLVFCDHYEAGEWRKADGKPMKVWKQAAVGWVNRAWKRGEFQVPHKDDKEKAGGQFVQRKNAGPAPFA